MYNSHTSYNIEKNIESSKIDNVIQCSNSILVL